MSNRVLHVCVLLGVLSLPASAQTAWERYLTLPTPGNARAVHMLTYSDTAANVDRLLEDLELLRDQLDAGDTAAVQLTFRLLPQADGVYAETLGNMLGRLVRSRPTLFLRELDRAQHQRSGPASQRGPSCHLARVTGPEYVDREEAGRYETRQRIASLRTVSVDSLRMLRDQCIAALQPDVTPRRPPSSL